MRHSRLKSRMAALCLLLAMTAPAAVPSSADDFATASFGESFILANAERYCERVPADCQLEPGEARPEAGEQIAGLLMVVNGRVNSMTAFRLDREQYGANDYWTVPANGFGDCEDYALAKRQMLIEAGLDPRNLRITLVQFFENGRAINHALLGVVTDRGMRFLDMNEDMVGDATAFTLRFGYRFEAMQSGSDFTVYETMRQPALRLAQTR